MLLTFESKDTKTKATEKVGLNMVKEVVEVNKDQSKQDFCFKIVVKSEFLMDKTFLFYCDTWEAKVTWMRRIKGCAQELTGVEI